MNEPNARAFVLGFEAGEASEQERIIQLLVDADTRSLTTEELKGWYFALTVIKGENK
jgi:hypothetical protein